MILTEHQREIILLATAFIVWANALYALFQFWKQARRDFPDMSHEGVPE